MQTKKWIALLFTLACASPSQAYVIATTTTGQGSKWEPGPNAASFFNPATPPGTPGSATWSLMPVGVPISLGDQAPLHNPGVLSTSVVGMTGQPDVDGQPYEIWAINDALSKWASVSGFTNLGQVADGPDVGGGSGLCGGVFNGCVDVGNIRIGAYPFNLSGGTVITAHAFQPGTTALGNFGSIGGDVHFNNDQNAAVPNQVDWVNDPSDVSGDRSIDFYTVVLHEMGHALGLGHSADEDSVMALYSVRGGALRDLSADDIAGIQAIYGPRVAVPEPGALALLAAGLLGLCLSMRRRNYRFG